MILASGDKRAILNCKTQFYNWLLRKSSCIPASSAKLLDCAAAGKSVVYRAGAGRGKNGINITLKKIAESNNPLRIKAAGHNASVDEHAELIAQAMAEAIAALAYRWCAEIGPIESIPKLKEKSRV
jgi:hypothetical protein